ncbi:unnamed protein product, partial [Mesorhabditis spiculigera]
MIDSHNLAHGLNYVQESLGKQLPVGTSRAIIAITDGFDQSNTQMAYDAAAQLKSEYFTISIVSSTTSLKGQSILQSIASDQFRYYPLDDLSWLINRGTLASTSYWICNAYYPTPAPITTQPTRVPLELSTAPPTTVVTATTTPAPTTPYANCPVDMVFLVDESQSMLDLWFDKVLTYVDNTARQVLKYQSSARFALVSFNKRIVYSSYNSSGFLDLTGLEAALKGIARTTDVVDYTVGLNEVINILATYGRQQNDSTVLPFVIFLTDGDQLANSMNSVLPITTKLRNQYKAEILGFGLNPNPYRESLIKQAIGVGSPDGYTPARYIRANTTDYLLATSPQDTGRLSVVYFSAPEVTGTLVSQSTNPVEVINKLTPASIPNGGASDLAGALNVANNIISKNYFGNNQVVILIARGLYIDGNSTNCCNDPQPIANELMKKAAVQAVMLGLVTNNTILQAISNQPVLNANALIKDGDSDINNGAAIAKRLDTVLDSIIANQPCQNIADFPPVCSEYIDVQLAFHANQTLMPKVRNFITQLLLPALFGGSLSDRPLTKSSTVNLALMTLDSSTTVTSLADFTQLYSPSRYAQIVSNVLDNATISTVPYVSKVYNQSIYNRQWGRPFATTIVIIISDAFSSSDYTNARAMLDRLQPAYAEAIQIGTLASPIPVSDGNPIIVPDINELDPLYIRSSKGLAVALAKAACRTLTTLPPSTPPTTTTARTTPAPLPRPKPRAVWPDITFLVDTSYDGTNAMTDQGFQQLRQFMYRYVLDELFIGDTGSRITLATFDDSVNVACQFSDIHNYYDLADCIVNKFEYSITKPKTKTRDLAGALDYLSNNVYNLTKGWIPAKENILVIFTTGSSTTNASRALVHMQQLMVRTFGINLGANMDPYELSLYGPDSYGFPNWDDQTHGIMGQNNFGSRMIEYFTRAHRQPLSNFYADFFFIVDESYAMNGVFDSVRTFILNFVHQLTLGDNKVRLWIVPFNSDVVQDQVLAQSGRFSDFESWWNNKFAYKQPANTTFVNIGAAIDAVAGYLNVTYQTDRMAHVTYIAQSPTVTGAEKAAQLQGKSNVANYVLLTNPAANYSQQLVTDGRQVFRMSSPKELNNWVTSGFGLNNMSRWFDTMAIFQENYRASHEMQLAEVQIDVAFAVDQTALANSAAFEAIKSYIAGFVSKFHISRTGTRFALQSFSARQVVEGGFHFMDNNDTDTVVNMIKNLKYISSSASASSDLVTTLSQINDFFLQPEKGWRNGPTYVVIFTGAQYYYNTTAAIADALKIGRKARVAAVGLTGSRKDFVQQFLTGKSQNLYPVVVDPLSLVDGSLPDRVISHDMTKWYEDLVYPVLPHIDDVQADFIFLIDYYNTLGTAGFAQVQNYLVDLIQNQVTTLGTTSRLAVVAYGYTEVMASYSWDLNAFHTQADLLNAVKTMSYYSRYVDSDLARAVEYFFHNDTFGYDANRLTFVVDIAVSPAIGRQIPFPTTVQLNRETFTYAYTYPNATVYPYLNQFLGEEAYEHLNVGYQFGAVDGMFKRYVVEAWQAWQANYG